MMRPFRASWIRIIGLFAAGQRSRQFDAELQSHLEMHIEDNVRQGMTREEARRQALIALGGVQVTRDAYRDRGGLPLVESVWMDVRHAVRSLRRSPGFTATAVLTLALGIGANTAIFSVVYGVLMRPLEYRDAERLVTFRTHEHVTGRAAPVVVNFSLPDLEVWQARGDSFESIAMSARANVLLASDAGSEVISLANVTPAFFDTAGARLRLGRGPGAGDGAVPSAVISTRLWRRAFGGDPAILGRPIVLDRQPHSIVGVVDESFQLPTPQTDVWRPVGFAQTLDPLLGGPRRGGFQPIARLRAGATLALAQRDADAIGHVVNASFRVTALPLRDVFLSPPVRRTLLVLLAAVSLVLLVACANVTNLILARNAARAFDMATRLALGATRGRLVRQALVHGGLLACAGTVGGLLLATASVDALAMLESGIPRLDAVRVDVPVLLFAATLAGATTLVMALLPALQLPPLGALPGRHGRRIAGGRGVHRVRRLLIVAEVAVTVVLLVGAGLLGRSLVSLLETDIGIDTGAHVTAALIDVSFGRQVSVSHQRRLIDGVIARVGAMPGVMSVGAGASMPPNLARLRFTMQYEADSVASGYYLVDAVTATPGYFTTLGLRLRQGRHFTAADDETRSDVMIVTSTTARQLFGDRDPIGRVLSLPSASPEGTRVSDVTVVGVVDDVRYAGIEMPANAVIYRPFAQQPWPSMFVAARTDRADPDFPASLRRAIAAVDPEIGIMTIDTLESLVSSAVAQPRFRAVVLIAIAGLAVMLAAVGVYGVVAYTVTQRTAEIGVRMALGATRADVTRLVIREGVWMATAGIVIGVLVAWLASAWIAGLLHGIAPTDPVSFAAAAAFLFLMTLAASVIPAARAGRMDPLVSLRQE